MWLPWIEIFGHDDTLMSITDPGLPNHTTPQPIWPGIIPAGAALPPGNTWLWKTGECKTLSVASSLPSLRVWARTGCDETFKCRTGTCRTEGSVGR